ncbi:MAG TPA: NRDE family protein, partial [Steroidobacteraceae bacterium]|nr:NRDE family protein [Steroidobacteraceae bacterium]
NHLLDTPWPKVTQAKSRLAEALDDLPQSAAMLDLLRDTEPAVDEDLPRTGVSLELERMLSSAFVRGEGYGTRCSTIVTTDLGGATTFAEWTWDQTGSLAGMTRYHFQIS